VLVIFIYFLLIFNSLKIDLYSKIVCQYKHVNKNTILIKNFTKKKQYICKKTEIHLNLAKGCLSNLDLDLECHFG